MTKNKKIIIIGGDTVALAVNFALSQQGYDTVVVSPHVGNPENLPYANGAARHHGNGDELIRALDYFDVPRSDPYRFRCASIVDGAIKPMTKSVGLEYLVDFHKKAYCVDRVRPADLAIQDSELNVHPETFRFDVRRFSALLHEYASPIIGTLDTINYSDGDICVKLEDGSFGCIEFGKLLIMEPPSEFLIHSGRVRRKSADLAECPEYQVVTETETVHWPETTQNKIVRVSSPGFAGLEYDAFYPFGAAAVHRITYNDGLYVCEANAEYSLEAIANDILCIFGHAEIDSFELREQQGYYLRTPAFNTPEAYRKIKVYGKLATGNWRQTLAESMNVLDLDPWLAQQ